MEYDLIKVMSVREFHNSPFESTLSVVATLRDGSIRSQVRATREHGNLIRASVQALKHGVDINELSAASGLTVQEIRDAASRPSDELEDLAGAR